MENGVYNYFIKTFRNGIFFYRPGVGDGTKLQFSTTHAHQLPSPSLCALHLAVCAVAHASSVVDISKKKFEHDMGP